MNKIIGYISADSAKFSLPRALRGESFLFSTPETTNADMKPTDHFQLLIKAIYPLALTDGLSKITSELENSLMEICHDALGVFCAIQCFYIQILLENKRKSPISINKTYLPSFLAKKILNELENLKNLEIYPGDADQEKSYRMTLIRMNILAAEHGIQWMATLPKP